MIKILLLSSLCLCATWSQGSAQERTVSGKVTSQEDASALPGVNVVLKGSAVGTVTDVEGNYRLAVPSSGAVLVFSFIGLTTQEIEVGERTSVDVQLSQDVQQLGEVVVSQGRLRQDLVHLTDAVGHGQQPGEDEQHRRGEGQAAVQIEMLQLYEVDDEARPGPLQIPADDVVVADGVHEVTALGHRLRAHEDLPAGAAMEPLERAGGGPKSKRRRS